MEHISIIDFEEKYAADFKRLNLEWLEKYGLTEQGDLNIVNDPFGMIINNGGCIYLAMCNGLIVGTAALINEGKHGYEFAKMSVTNAFQGKGISKLLMERCIDKARELGLRSIFLVSNNQLKTAVKLYEKYGFRHVPVVDTPFLTADIRMELSL